MTERTCPNCGKPYQVGDEVCGFCGFVFPFSTVILTTGTILHGRYEIQELIHTGGMGYVYLAKDKNLFDRLCIVKQIRESIKSEDHRRKLEEEALRMARLNHPNIAIILDHFVESGYYFLVVERIIGKTLSEVFKERQGPISEDEVVRWALAICDVVIYIHKEGVIHRDISPDNIMLTEDGSIKFIDFGTLREFRYVAAGGTAGMGKYGYTPPEQWQGKPEQRSDLFALGATIYHLLTGFLPLSKEYITGQGPQKGDFYPQFPPVRTINPKITSQLEVILQKALQLEVANRFNSAVEMRQALRNLEQVTQPGTEPVPGKKKFVLSRKYSLAAIILLLVIGGVIAGVLLLRDDVYHWEEAFDRLENAHVPILHDKQTTDPLITQPVVESRYTTNPPSIDGVLAPGEWDLDISKTFEYRVDNQLKKGELNIDFTSDDLYLYAALKINIPDLKEGMLEKYDSWFYVQFFTDNDGTIKPDEINREFRKVYGSKGTIIHDDYSYRKGVVSEYYLRLTDDTPAGKGAAGYDKQTNSYIYEQQIPLNSGDTGDFAARAGDTINVKFLVTQRVKYKDTYSNRGSCGWPDIGAFDISTYAKLVLGTSGLPQEQQETVNATVTTVAGIGDNMWKKYIRTGVYEDTNTYIPTPADFGEYVGLVKDDSVLIPTHVGDEYSVVGFRTWVYCSTDTSMEIGIIGDDGVGLYVDKEFICGRGNAEDPMSYGTMELLAGWYMLEALVYNGPTGIALRFDKKTSDYVDIMNSQPDVTSTPAPETKTESPVQTNEGLVAYYPFDGNANDESGNGHHGSVHGAVLTSDKIGETGSAYMFYGNDYIDIPIDISETTYSASLWFRTTSPGGILSITNGPPGSDSYDRQIYLDSKGNVCVRVWKDETICTDGNAYLDGEYHHVVHILDGTNQYIYVDGELQKEGNKGTSDFDWQTDLLIGFCINADNDYFTGSIDDVRIYNRALSEAEIQALYEMALETPTPTPTPTPLITFKDGLVAYYPFDGNANDESGNGHHGTIHGTILAVDRFGNPDSAYNFDGSDDYVEVPHHADFDFGTGSFTVSAWINTTATTTVGSGRDDILAKGDPAVSGYAISIRNNKAVFWVGGSGKLFGTSDLNDGGWHHIVGIRDDSSNIVLYVDSIAEDTSTNSEVVDTDYGVFIGKHGTKNESYFDGFIDDVRIYNRALSEAEIQALYEMALETPTPTPIRVNCAGSDYYIDTNANVWEADQAYVSGQWGFYGGDYTADRGTGLAIINTDDGRIFQTERYSMDGYRFDLGNGTYDVSLYFAETYSDTSGEGLRIFDVYIEGQLVLDNLDIYSEVGSNVALIKTFRDISVTDGQLTIEFSPVTENPSINGIMITDSGIDQAPPS